MASAVSVRRSSGRGSQQRPKERHEQRRAHSLVADVRDDEPDATAGKVEGVVEIPGALPGRFEARRDLPALRLRKKVGKKRRLNLAADLKLPFEALGTRTLAVAQAFLLERGVDPRLQESRIERFRKIVLRAELDAPDDRLQLLARRDHDHRNVSKRFVRLHPRERLAPVQFRHHDVQQNEVEPAAPEHLQGGEPVLRRRDFVPMLPQAARQNVSIHLVVVDDKEPKGSCLAHPAARSLRR